MTYWTRPLAVVAALAMVFLVFGGSNLEPGEGGRVFALLHLTIFWTIWLCVPLMTADCISRERREQTLGLLFLTPLKPWEVVTAKTMIYGLRAFLLWLSVIPVLAIPMILGGLAALEVLFSVLVLFGVLCGSVAVGIFVSSHCRERNRAMLLAVIASGVWIYLSCELYESVFEAWMPEVWGYGWRYRLDERGLWLLSNLDQIWSDLLATFRTDKQRLIGAFANGALVALLVSLMLIMLAARQLRQSMQEKPVARWRRWVADWFCTPTYAVDFYYRWLKQRLHKNPIGWLEQRRWSGRMATWIWFAVAVAMAIGAAAYPNTLGDRDGLLIFKFFYWVMAVWMAIIAAGSFGRERALGVMELLLISPLKEKQIVSGRLRGIWMQFLPSAVLLLAAYGLGHWRLDHNQRYLYQYLYGEDRTQICLWYFTVLLTGLPIVGLYCSLRFRHYLTSLVMTLALGILLPWLIYKAAHRLLFLELWRPYSFEPISHLKAWVLSMIHVEGLIPGLILAATALALLRSLHRRLVRRNFHDSGSVPAIGK